MIKLRPYQIEVKNKVFAEWEKHQNILLVLPTGAGKCLGVDTPVLMYDGSIRKVQDVKKGDKLMGDDSTPRKVLSIAQGKEELFRVTPVKGDSWVCNRSHILSLVNSETSEIVDISVDDYLKKSKNFKHLHKQFRTGVEFEESKLEFDPYVLGVYLAEGTHGLTQMTNPDEEVIEYIENYAVENNIDIFHTKKENHSEIRFSKNYDRSNVLNSIRKLCTSRKSRHIPKEYLTSSSKNRLELLAGLLDGDGYYHIGGYEIITKYDQLKDDILFLSRSLGLAAYSSIKIGRIKKLNFEGKYHRIFISGETDKIPCKVERKKAKPRKQIKSVLRTGFELESLGIGDYYGFEIDGNHRFLLGDFTVTHNTKTFVSIIKDLNEPTLVIVHRKELVSQISMTLAEEGIKHNIISPVSVIRQIIGLHRGEVGASFYDAKAQVIVASVDTFNSRAHKYGDLRNKIKYWVCDEAAHLLNDNKWGRAVKLFPNAKGLGVTATPERLDKKGLGRKWDGVFDKIIVGVTPNWLIQNGFLSKYKIVVPKSDYSEYLGERASSTADYTYEQMRQASERSHIVGDTVKNYLEFAKGMQTIVFCTDIESATKMEAKFIEAGVKAKLLTGDTNPMERHLSVKKFSENEIQVLLNIDLFDEGFDCPVKPNRRIIECVIMSRPSASVIKVLQQIGRALRPAPNKEHAIVIDQVNNIKRHGLPDDDRKWSLARPEKTMKKASTVRICGECAAAYPRIESKCPYCGTPYEAPVRAGGGRIPPDLVDGDLMLIDPDTLREINDASILESPESMMRRVEFTAGVAAGKKAFKTQKLRLDTQRALADKISWWAAHRQAEGLDNRQIHIKFYIEFGVTILQALAESVVDMKATIESLEGN